MLETAIASKSKMTITTLPGFRGFVNIVENAHRVHGLWYYQSDFSSTESYGLDNSTSSQLELSTVFTLAMKDSRIKYRQRRFFDRFSRACVFVGLVIDNTSLSRIAVINPFDF